MDLFVFDAKRGHRHQKSVPVAVTKDDVAELIGEGNIIDAFLVGGLVSIFNERHIEILYEFAGIGQLLEDCREDKTAVSQTCFTSQVGENDFEFREKDAEKWKEMFPSMQTLTLSPEETVFLALEWKILNVRKGSKTLNNDEIWQKMTYLYGSGSDLRKFATSFCLYRFLKNAGWVVRNGIMFGCQFLIYSLGPKYYHSSAGVHLVGENVEPLKFVTLTRILAHNKKAVVLANVEFPENSNVQCYDDVENVKVTTVVGKTYFLDRDVPQISLKCSELYEVKQTLD